MDQAVQIDAKNPQIGSRCNCEDRSFKRKDTLPILGHVECDGCADANLDHYWVCQKNCGYKFCNKCMDKLEYPRNG